MPYVQVPKDLTKVKTKVALNLTKRQLICFSVAAVIGVPVYLLTHRIIGNSAAALLMIALMLPGFFLAMYEKDGQPAEKILRNFLRTRLLWPGTRIYKTENLYEMIEKEKKPVATKGKTTASAAKRAAGQKRQGRDETKKYKTGTDSAAS